MTNQQIPYYRGRLCTELTREELRPLATIAVLRDAVAALRAGPEPPPAPTTLLEKAVADRDARPWRYYRFERDGLLKWLDKIADENARLKAASRDAGAVPAPSGSGWQPIETAPKDGTRVLVALIRDGRIWRVSDAAFNGLGWYTTQGGVACHWRTHWMPLPDPPRDPGARDEAQESRSASGRTTEADEKSSSSLSSAALGGEAPRPPDDDGRDDDGARR